MFVLKKVIARFFFPLPLGLELIALGLLALFVFRSRQRLGRWLVLIGTAILIISSTPLVPKWAMQTLESKHPKAQVEQLARAGPKWIVVLGGGHYTDPGLALSAQAGTATLYRLAEALRLARRLPQARLLLSGYAGKDQVSDALFKSRLARSLGYTGPIVLEERPRDTAEEAALITDRLGGQPFVLVTSAAHMPRAMALFQAQGGATSTCTNREPGPRQGTSSLGLVPKRQ